MQRKWVKIQSILEKSLANGQYKVWIAPLSPRWEKEGLVLQAQNEFVASFVRTRFLPVIEKAVQEVLEAPCSVQVQCTFGQTSDAAVPAVSAPAAPRTPASAKTSPAALILPAAKAQASSSQKTSAAAAPSALLLSRSPAPAPTPAATIIKADVEQPRDSRPAPRPLSSLQMALPLQMPEKPVVARVDRNWRHRFEDFVVGPSNELAYAASRSMCNNMRGSDILFLSSAPGLGKTHLMQAVGKALGESCNRTAPKVEYLTAEEFASRFYLSLKGQDTDRFKARYRDVDLLLLEDVHFLQGKEKMQAELLATIKSLQDRGSKVVFTSSFAPRDLRQMDDQLQSRLSSGLMSFIERPDHETRKRILRHKASMHQVLLPDDVENVLAQHIHADVRQIESCLQNLILKAKLFNSCITMQMAWEVIGNYASHSPILNMDTIIMHVCQGFGLTQDQLFSSRRKQEYVSARNTAFFLARKHTDLSLEAIGQHFNRKHSTVLKGITNLEREMSRQTPVGRQIANTLTMIERNGNIVGAMG